MNAINWKYHTTTYMHSHHPDHIRANSKDFLNLVNDKNIQQVSLFSNDLVIIKYGHKKHNMYRFEPCDIRLIKYLWDIANKDAIKTLKKHIRRSKHIHEQFMHDDIPDDVVVWYMAIFLGSNK